MTAKPTIAALQRAYDQALAAEHRAVAAVPETPPRHTPSPAAKVAAERAWAAAARTNAACKALTAAIDGLPCVRDDSTECDCPRCVGAEDAFWRAQGEPT